MLLFIFIALVSLLAIAIYWSLSAGNKNIVAKATGNTVGFVTVGAISHTRSAIRGTWKLGRAIGNDIELSSSESIVWLDDNINTVIKTNGGVVKAAAKTAKEHREDFGLDDLGKSIDKYYVSSVSKLDALKS
jgi:hypothetical protein